MSARNGGPVLGGIDHDVDGDTPMLAQATGLTVRDYFAAAALPGLLADAVRSSGYESTGRELLVAVPVAAYRIADAMLAVRAKGQS